MCDRKNFSAIACGGTVNFVIETEFQVVEHGLLIAGTEAGEDFSFEICLVISVGVFHVPDVGRGCDVDTPFPGDDTTGPEEFLGEDGGFVIDAIVVGVS